jgi:hypothetical protein
VLKVYSKTKIIPATNDPSVSWLSLENTFPGTSELFPEVPGCSQASLLKSLVPGGSGIRPGGSGVSKVTVVVPDLRVFIPPHLPTVIFFSPAPNSSFCSHSLPSIDSHQLESKSNSSIQVWSDSLWEKANPSPFLCSWALGGPLAPWWIFYSWSLTPRRLEVAWKALQSIVEAPRSLYYPHLLSGNLPSITLVIGVREEWI